MAKNVSSGMEPTVSDEPAPLTNRELYAAGARTFAEAMAEADVIIGGGDLWKDEDLDRLIGVPFAVVGGTFRNAMMREVHGIKMRGDYVTLHCILADEDMMRRSRVDWESRDLTPGAEFLFNDGGTGVRRQMVAYAVAKGYVTLSDTPVADLKTSGALGECDFDYPVQMWKDIHIGDVKFDGGDETTWTFELPRMLVAKRGLRVSTYDTEMYGENSTRYLA